MAASRRTSVPVMLVVMKSALVCEPTWGLWSVAAWMTWVMRWVAKRSAMKVVSVMEPTKVVVGLGLISMPMGA